MTADTMIKPEDSFAWLRAARATALVVVLLPSLGCGSSAPDTSNRAADGGATTTPTSPSRALDAGTGSALAPDAGGTAAAAVDAGAQGSLGGGDAAAACGTALDQKGCPCSSGSAPRSCYAGSASQAGVGSCTLGQQSCVSQGELGGVWGACSGSGAPITCTAAAAQCGALSDGCGGSLDCGTCPSGESCGSAEGGVPNVCAPTCAANQGAACVIGSQTVTGCGAGLTCLGAEGAWYNSPSGCSMFPCVVPSGGSSAVFSCSAATYDPPSCGVPLSGVPTDGTCYAEPPSYGIPNTYFMYLQVDDSMCTRTTTQTGTVQCDGSCS